jgi:glyoxylase-like metal-dependent hydrolase (beta-lactamase superfamily II)
MNNRSSSVFTSALVMILAAAGGSLGCSTYAPPTAKFAAPPPSASTWDEVFAHPSDATVETLTTGEVEVSRSLLLDLEDRATAGMKDDSVSVPVLAHLIRHPSKGDLLVDTGLDHTFTTSGHGNVGGLASLFSFCRQAPGQDIASQLRARGAAPKSVLYTHLHVDHTAGTPDLDQGARFIAGKGSLKDAYLDESGVVMHLSHLDGVKELSELDFAGVRPMLPLGPSIDVLGDGSVWAVWTPGHSIGHVSYVVNAKSGPVLLTGDASHTRWGFEHDVEPGKVTDRAGARRSLGELRAFVRAYPAVRVVYGHELSKAAPGGATPVSAQLSRGAGEGT